MNELLGRITAWSNRKCAIRVGILSVAVGVVISITVYGLTGPGPFWLALIFGGASTTLTAVAVFFCILQLRQTRRTREIRSLTNVRPLTRRLPLDLGSYAANPLFADAVVRTLCRRRPDQIVECGSGWTTVLMATCLAQLQNGEVLALEHDERFADRTRDLLLAAGGSARGSVVFAPLERQDVAGEERLWYNSDVLRSVRGPIDVLLVDGPPGHLAPKVRYPAVPLLKRRLAEDCIIFLDDGFRDDEANIAQAWGQALDIDPDLRAHDSGFWVLDRASHK